MFTSKNTQQNTHQTSEILPLTVEKYRSSITMDYQMIYCPKLVCFNIPEPFFASNSLVKLHHPKFRKYITNWL